MKWMSSRPKALVVSACVGLVGPVILVTCLTSGAAARPKHTWSDIAYGPTISNGSTITYDQYYDLMKSNYSMTGDLSCEKERVDYGPNNPGDPNDCWYKSSIGLISSSGVGIKLKGEQYAGIVNSGQSQLFPTPNPDIFIELVSDYSSGLYHVYFRNIKSTAMTEINSGYPRLYKFNEPAPCGLVDSNGQPWELDDNTVYSEISYSNDGRWMVIWHGGTVTRVDLQNFTSTDVHIENSEEANDDNDFALMTISDDGKYLAVAVQGKFLRMYGVKTCLTAYDSDGKPAGECVSYRELDYDLDHFIGQSLIDVFVGMPKFINNDLLSVYAPDRSSVGGGYDEYYVRAPHTWTTTYIALGDSYASGEGEPNSTFYAGTDIKGINMCHLSKLSYPFLIGLKLQLYPTRSVACSGAKTTNIATGNNLEDVAEGSQYHSPDFDYNQDWTPGYTSQLNYINAYKPSVITVSAGGNDIGFSHIIERCIEADTCFKYYEDREELIKMIDNQFPKLVDMYKAIKEATIPDARIYVIGYPSIIKSDGDCGDNVRLNGDETVFANDLEYYLDETIRAAAENAGVFYVDTGTAFYGHRLCEKDVGGAAVNGLTIGHDTKVLDFDVLSNGSYHPTVLGHKLLAKRIEKATDDFTAPMPRADATITQAPDIGREYLLAYAPKSGRPLQPLNYDDNLTNNVIYRDYRGKEVTDSNWLKLEGLKALTWVSIFMHSKSVDLGSYRVDTNGNLSVKLKIPKSVPTGFHTVYAVATLPNGQTEKFFRTVYVAANPDDLDGDGVPNSQEPCLIFEVPKGQTKGAGYNCEATGRNSSIPSAKPVNGSGPTSGRSGSNKYESDDAPESSHALLFSTAKRGSEITHDSVPRPRSSTKSVHGLSSIWPWWAIGATLVVVVLTFFWRLRYAGHKQ